MEDKKVTFKEFVANNGYKSSGIIKDAIRKSLEEFANDIIVESINEYSNTIKTLVDKYPNDMDLGRVVRSMFSNQLLTEEIFSKTN